MTDITAGPGEKITEINADLTLISRTDGLQFGTDAYLLAAFVRRRPSQTVVDLGTGTGIVPLLLCRWNKCAGSIGYEIQPDFADLARRNAELNGLADRIEIRNEDIRKIPAYTLVPPPDVVTANPPYLKADGGKINRSGRKALARHELEGGIRDFTDAAGRLLQSGGLACFVYRPDRLTELMAGCAAVRLEPKRMVFIYPDTESAPSLVLLEAQKDGNPGLRVLPPLIAFADPRDHRTYTPVYQSIYDTGNVPDEGILM